MVAFNLLRTLGQEVIERKTIAPQKINAKRWRLKTVLQNIIYCAVRHAGGIELHFGKRCPWFDVIRDIASTYAEPSHPSTEPTAHAEEGLRPRKGETGPK